MLEKLDVRTQRKTEFVSITKQIQQIVKRYQIQSGICHIYVPHTTAGITINESADPMVSHDILLIIDEIIPFVDRRYQHMEDNSAAHVRASLFGSSEPVIIENEKLVLGTWQGIFFCEFDGPRNREIYVKILEG